MSKALFITLEGSEGVGKSTNLAFIQDYLRQNSIDLLVTREPGGTRLGERLRELLLDLRQQAMADDTELLLMFAARAQHIHERIQPALQQGQWVLSDRFTDASFAYQGGGRGLSMERIGELEHWVQGTFRPDVTFLLDVSVEIGMQRVAGRGETDRFEREQLDFFRRVRDTYLQRAQAEPQRFRVIDASCPLEGVQTQLREHLDVLLQQQGAV